MGIYVRTGESQQCSSRHPVQESSESPTELAKSSQSSFPSLEEHPSCPQSRTLPKSDDLCQGDQSKDVERAGDVFPSSMDVNTPLLSNTPERPSVTSGHTRIETKDEEGVENVETECIVIEERVHIPSHAVATVPFENEQEIRQDQGFFIGTDDMACSV